MSAAPSDQPATVSATARYLPQFDGLRGIAALSVVVDHFNPAPLEVPPDSSLGVLMGICRDLALGNLAVAFFFALSAFLLTYLACHEIRSTGSFSISRFFVRRILRIWPLYFCVLLVAYFLNSPYSPLPQPFVASPKTWQWLKSHVAWFALFGSNWSLTFNYVGSHVDPSPDPLRILWSIAVEEQFYAIFPFLVFLILRRPRIIPWIFLTGLLLGWGFRGWFAALHPANPGLSSSGGMYYATFSYTDVLLFGSAAGWLAAQSSRIKPMGWIRRPALGPLFLLACLALGRLWSSNLWYPYNFMSVSIYALLGVVFAGALLWVYHQDGSPLVRFLGSKPLRALGVLSYGIYMWHVISNICLATALDRWAKYSILSPSPWLRLAASLTMAIAFAAVSRWLVERAFLRLKHRWQSLPAPRTLSG